MTGISSDYQKKRFLQEVTNQREVYNNQDGSVSMITDYDDGSTMEARDFQNGTLQTTTTYSNGSQSVSTQFSSQTQSQVCEAGTREETNDNGEVSTIVTEADCSFVNTTVVENGLYVMIGDANGGIS